MTAIPKDEGRRSGGGFAYVRNALGGGGWLLLPTIALLAAAVWMPKLPVTRDAYDHMVIFDVSQSMNVEDYRIGDRVVSRLAFAKHAVAEALKNPKCDTRIGWAVFAGRKIVTLLAPVEVCRNYSALLEALEGRCAQAGLRLSRGHLLEASLVRDEPVGSDAQPRCATRQGSLAVDADGLVTGCPGWPRDSWPGGSLRTSSLDELWRSTPACPS